MVSGTMTSGCGSKPACLALAAPSRMAEICILTSPGITRQRRTPRVPIIGLLSCIALAFDKRVSFSSSIFSSIGAPHAFLVLRTVTSSKRVSYSGKNS